jgi:protein-S-isoprenylcysteine O-methyltransferase Ste14
MASLLTGYALMLAFFLALPWSKRVNRAFATDRAGTRRTSIALGLVHTLALVLPLAAALVQPGPPVSSAVSWAAVGSMAAAFVLQRWSQHSLGPSFTLALQSAPHQEVCRRGPYRWVRHPAYLAQIIFFTAFALTGGSRAVAAVVGIAAIAGYAYRIREEERMLLTTLGDRYADYAASTRRLIPFLY